MIEKSLRDYLISNTALMALVTGGIHLDRNNSAKDNYLVIDINSNSYEYSNHGEQSQIDCQIQVNCYSSSKTQVKAIEKALKQTLNLASFTDEYVKVQSVYKQSSLPSFEPDTRLYSEACDYLVYYNEV